MTFVRPAPRPHRGRIAERHARGRRLWQRRAGGAAPAPAAAVDLTKKGPIEVWQGKDTSGNFEADRPVQRAAPGGEGHLPRAAG